MSNQVKVELEITDEEKSKELMSKAVADIIKMKIEKLPEHLRLKAYDMILKEIEMYK